jgi:hypothetical protein
MDDRIIAGLSTDSFPDTQQADPILQDAIKFKSEPTRTDEKVDSVDPMHEADFTDNMLPHIPGPPMDDNPFNVELPSIFILLPIDNGPEICAKEPASKLE